MSVNSEDEDTLHEYEGKMRKGRELLDEKNDFWEQLADENSCAARLPAHCPAPTAALRVPRDAPARHRPPRSPLPALGSRTPRHCTQNSTSTTAEDAAQHRTHLRAPARGLHEHARAARRGRSTQQPPDPIRTAAGPNSMRAKPPRRRPAPALPKCKFAHSLARHVPKTVYVPYGG